jgi:nitrogen fixation protein NifU and related proteins
MYSKKTISHFRNPHNIGEIKNADGKGEAGNIVCGDVMSLYIKVIKNKQGAEIIKDVKFKTYGCAAAIATSSAVTDLVKGKTIEKALKVNKNNIVDFLEGLPPIKIHCSILAIDALGEAIYQYLISQKRTIPAELFKLHQRIELSKKSIEDRYRVWKSSSVAKS